MEEETTPAASSAATLEAAALAPDVDPPSAVERIPPLADRRPVVTTPSGPDGPWLAGRVIDSEGRPAAASVIAYDDDGFPTPDVRSSAATGAFRIEPLSSDGPFRVSARSEGAFVERTGVRPNASDLVLELAVGHTLRGTVVDDRGLPVPAFTVLATRQPYVSGRLLTVTGEQGAFELHGLDEAGWNVEVLAPGRAGPDGQTLRVPHEAPLEFRLPRESGLVGIVRDVRGAPVSHLRVVASRGSTREAVHAGPDGAFRFGPLRAGEWTLRVQGDPAWTCEPLEVSLAPGGVVDGLVLVAGAPATLQGTVVDGAAVPLAGIRVAAHPDLPTLVTDPDGRFELTAVTPGNVRLRARVEGLELEQELRIGLGETREVWLALPGTCGRIQGTITVDGDPPREARVQVVPPGKGVSPLDEDRGVAVAPDGTYSLRVAEPGACTFALLVGDEDLHTWPLEVGSSGETRHDLALETATIEGRVVGGDGQPRAWCEVLALTESERLDDWTVFHRQHWRTAMTGDPVSAVPFHRSRATTDAQGRFTLQVLPGQVRVCSGLGVSCDRILTVTAGEHRAGIELVE